MPQMKPKRRQLLAAGPAALLPSALLPSALLRPRPARAATDWPTRPVRVVMGYPPGGPTDFPARLLQPSLQAVWGQPLVIENRPGANGMIANEAVAKSAPDGHTLLMGAATLTANVALYPNQPVDPLRDLAPVVLIYSSPTVLFTTPQQPFPDVAAVVAAAREAPGRLTYSTSGNGSGGNFAGALFARAAGIELTHVAYRGTAPALQDVIAGRVPLTFSTLAGSIALLRDGKLRPLAIAGPDRFPDLLPGVPTLPELGYDTGDCGPWYGLLAPAGTPPAIVAKVAEDVSEALRQPEIRARFGEQGGHIVAEGPEPFAERIRHEVPRWVAAVRATGLRSE
ncbi:tripartite tricarboxylate transporter substrate-binding protein [Roseomonas sp. NAR14]|uniref:Tripartite tricarboxylate transporter substrate-binding protein n=1 Tax=Roseomonas acroporae TaxID=2937791 RepID=A0A9X2BUH4_9PROT|nr:tripartite tricarboxylate transporter substrate-binding protein [Roseomonas acroporae]MCK8785638.1 tripartite tricarboxylate transporter substrate-binding protein [Roseomonas acroporae]